MKIKLVVTDLDNTVVGEDNLISQRTAEAFRRAKEQGVHIAVATGRSLDEGWDQCVALGASEYVIALTGCQLYDVAGKQDVFRHTLSLEQAVEIGNILHEYPDVYTQLYWKGDVYIEPNSEKLMKIMRFPGGYEEYKRRFVTVVDSLAKYQQEQKWPGEKYFFVASTVGQFREIRDRLQEIEGLYLTAAYQTGLEILPWGSDKGTALKALREHLKVKKEEVMVLGDSENDIQMFEEGGFCVAVGNAFQSLKDRADYIAPSCPDDGAAYAVEKFVLA